MSSRLVDKEAFLQLGTKSQRVLGRVCAFKDLVLISENVHINGNVD